MNRHHFLARVFICIPFTLICSLNAVEAQDKVVASWSFDSVSGKTFFDVTGNGHDAFASGDSVRIVDGLSGKALECLGPASDTIFNTFDIQIKKSLPDFNLQKFAIEAWIYSYVDIYNPGSFYNHRDIFEHVSCGLEGSGITGGYALAITDSAKPFFCWADPSGGSWSNITGDSIVSPNRWYHIVATCDGMNMKVYLNGGLCGQMSWSQGYLASTQPTRIGCQYQITGDATGRTRQMFRGKIDELKLYNYALDSQTIKQHYDALKPAEEVPFKINFGMKITYCNPGDTVWVPIYLTNFEDFAISACQFSINIDTSKIKLLSVSKDSGLVKGPAWLLGWDTVASNPMVALGGTTQSIKYGEGEFVRCKFFVNPGVRKGDTAVIRMENINIDENNLITAVSTSGKIIMKKLSFIYGDVTGDSCIDERDARDILSYVVGMIALPDSVKHPHFTLTVADVSGNGSITSYDAALVFQYSMGLLSEFPIMKSYSLNKSASSVGNGSLQSATLSISLASQSEIDGMKFNIMGTNLNGFVAGEFAIAYDSSVANVKNGNISTTLKGATLVSRLDGATNDIKIALATNDDVSNSDSVVLATITLPPNATNDPAKVFTLKKALLNEGKIQSNVPSGSLVGIGERNSSRPVMSGFNVTYGNQALHIRIDSRRPIRVQIFTMNGRTVENRVFEPQTLAPVQLSLKNYPHGAYIFRVTSGNCKAGAGRIMVVK